MNLYVLVQNLRAHCHNNFDGSILHINHILGLSCRQRKLCLDKHRTQVHLHPVYAKNQN